MPTATITLPTRIRDRRRTTRQATCHGCGIRRRTEATGDYWCRDCRPATKPPTPLELHVHALTDGHWIRRGLIWHWQPNPTDQEVAA